MTSFVLPHICLQFFKQNDFTAISSFLINNIVKMVDFKKFSDINLYKLVGVEFTATEAEVCC